MKTYRSRLLVILAVLFLTALACNFTAPIDEKSVASGGVLFQDDFSSNSSGWDKVRSPEEGITDYENGGYRIQVLNATTEVWANPGLKFTDVHIEVDATKLAGPDDNDFGVICRYKDDKNFYYMTITSDGYYGILKVTDGNANLLGGSEMNTSDQILKGTTSNHIRADCEGSTLKLYVNGQLLDTQSDSDYTEGDVGLIAGTYTTPGTDILFDNFTVTKP